VSLRANISISLCVHRRPIYGRHTNPSKVASFHLYMTTNNQFLESSTNLIRSEHTMQSTHPPPPYTAAIPPHTSEAETHEVPITYWQQWDKLQMEAFETFITSRPDTDVEDVSKIIFEEELAAQPNIFCTAHTVLRVPCDTSPRPVETPCPPPSRNNCLAALPKPVETAVLRAPLDDTHCPAKCLLTIRQSKPTYQPLSHSRRRPLHSFLGLNPGFCPGARKLRQINKATLYAGPFAICVTCGLKSAPYVPDSYPANGPPVNLYFKFANHVPLKTRDKTERRSFVICWEYEEKWVEPMGVCKSGVHT
jgi:hypothetical protein